MTVSFWHPCVEFAADDECGLMHSAKLLADLVTRAAAAATLAGTTFGDFLAKAIRSQIEARPAVVTTPPFFTITDELEAARVQSSALHFLLIDAMAGQTDSTYGEEIDRGIRELAMQTDGRLKRAIEAATDNRQEVAS